MDGIHSFLAWMDTRGLRRGLVTRNSRKSVELVLGRLGFDFDAVITREDAPPKPAPDPVWAGVSWAGRRAARGAVRGRLRVRHAVRPARRRADGSLAERHDNRVGARGSHGGLPGGVARMDRRIRRGPVTGTAGDSGAAGNSRGRVAGRLRADRPKGSHRHALRGSGQDRRRPKTAGQRGQLLPGGGSRPLRGGGWHGGACRG